MTRDADVSTEFPKNLNGSELQNGSNEIRAQHNLPMNALLEKILIALTRINL